MITRLMLIIISWASYATILNASDSAIVLGVLEDVPGHYAGEPNIRGVRVVFQKSGKDWRAFRSDCRDQACLRAISSEYPRELTWTVAFDGRNLGQITGRTPEGFQFYADVGLQQITSKGPVPTIGERATKYSGFIEAPVFRPLIADSQTYFQDPESWKPCRLSTEPIAAVRRQFRRKYPSVSNCAKVGEAGAEKLWPYRDEDIRIMKAYSSKGNWSIAQVRLHEYRCDGPSDDAFVDQWFVISPGREVKFLAQGMWLVDAGDYDNDGKSELVFSIDRYNRGGYELFYDDFKKHVIFEYGYH
jgi:hypothetical protein